MDTCCIQTPVGFAVITGGDNGIASIQVMDNEEETISRSIPYSLKDCVFQLQEYFEGSRKNFDLQLNPNGTVFQKRVWRELTTIPHGNTISYLELSKRIGNTKAIRAVANANSKNPIWIIIPCHRVIGKDGSLTGYAGGLYLKQWLLDHECLNKQQVLF